MLLQRIIFVLIIWVNLLPAQEDSVLTKASYSLKHVLKEKGGAHLKWLYFPEDKPEFANRNFNDSDWHLVNPGFAKDSSAIEFVSPSWFRMYLLVDTLQGSIVSLMLNHTGASEIYLNGVLVENFGVVSEDKNLEERFQPASLPVKLDLPNQGFITIAIRYSNTKYQLSNFSERENKPGFGAMYMDYYESIKSTLSSTLPYVVLGVGFSIFFLTLCVIHLILYLFYKARKSNFIYSVLCFLVAYILFHSFIVKILPSIDFNEKSGFISFIFGNVFFFLLPYLVGVIFDFQNNKLLKYFAGIVLLNSILVFIKPGIASLILLAMVPTSILFVVVFLIKAVKSGKKGAGIIFTGFGFFILIFALLSLIGYFGNGLIFDGFSITAVLFFLSVFLSIISIPLSMTILLAKEFSYTSITLQIKLEEVETLSVKTIEQEKEKQKILANQNIILEQQVKERTKEIEEQKKVIEEKNKDITDSINYAQRIQHSILPTSKEIKDIFPDSLVLFKPRDIVSGDFYQFKQLSNYKFGILADCTGHGVPGALMSMIGSNLLHQIIMERKIVKPNLILTELHKEVKSTLRQTAGVQSHDGMDIAVCMVNGNELFVASANRPIYLFVDGNLNEIKPDKKSIGGASTEDIVEFTLHSFKIDKDLKLYTFSDGYADQFGGVNGKKFKVKNLQELIVTNVSKSFNEQLEILNTAFENWRGTLEQVDDVSLISIHLKP